MAPFRRQAIARRHQASAPTGRSVLARRISHDQDVPRASRDGQLVRGLVIGLPLGLAIWLALALLIWAFA